MFSRQALTKYNGLTIVMSNPSRFDKDSLLTGQIESLYEKILNRNGSSLLGADLLLTGESNIGDELRDDTKCLLIHGQKALSVFKPGVSVKEQRGSPFESKILRPSGEVLRISSIATFDPQDSIDPQNWEARKNPLLNGEDTDGEGSTEDLKSTHGATRRDHYQFWFQKDLAKVCRYVKHGWHPHVGTKILVQPSSKTILEALTKNKGKYFYLDIETDAMLNLTCWGFSFLPKDTYDLDNLCPKLVIVVPFYDYNGRHSYSKMATVQILRALSIALRDNTVVCHNCLFDLFVLAWKYRIAPGKLVEDTMLMTHRCYPEMEKSLGHTISLWTDQEYHKNEGVFEPKNFQAQSDLRLYNAKDVESMMLVHQKIRAYARKDKGLRDSFQQANESIRPYLLLNLTGYRMDIEWLKEKIAMNDRLMMQYLRICEMLCGYEINPGSSDQVGSYLISVGVKLAIAEPTNERNLYKYMLKQDLPLLRVVIKYRGVKKETSALKFRRYYGIGVINEH